MLLEISSMTSTIISSIVLFLGVSILLVVILLVAKKYLVPSGKATITINNDKQIEVETGSSLLSTLSNEKIFLPSAFGGGGSCAQCRCQVLEGGGEILPTEQVHFSHSFTPNTDSGTIIFMSFFTFT